jgi:hypothetical protein
MTVRCAGHLAGMGAKRVIARKAREKEITRKTKT